MNPGLLHPVQLAHSPRNGVHVYQLFNISELDVYTSTKLSESTVDDRTSPTLNHYFTTICC